MLTADAGKEKRLMPHSLKKSVRSHNNLTFSYLLGQHLDNCPECRVTQGKYCRAGLLLRMALGRTVNARMYEPLKIRRPA